MAELGEVLSQLGEGVDPEAFAEALHKSQPDLYQVVFNAGFNTSKGSATEKQKELEKQLKDRDAKLASQADKIKELSEASPDTDKIQKKYQDQILSYQEEIENLKTKHSDELNELRGGRKSDKRSTFKTNTVNHLVSLGVDKDYAEVLVNKSEFDSRIRQSDDTGDITEIGQRENVDLPMVLPKGAELVGAVAQDLFKTVPSKFIDDSRPRGAGIGEFSTSGKLRVSETQNWSDAEYQKRWPEIQQAMREGRLIDDTA